MGQWDAGGKWGLVCVSRMEVMITIFACGWESPNSMSDGVEDGACDEEVKFLSGHVKK